MTDPVILGQPARRVVIGPLPLVLLGGLLGAAGAGLVASGYGSVALLGPLALGGVYVLVRYPFAAVLAWLLVFPFFTTGSVQLFWLFHRVLIPVTLALALGVRLLGDRPRRRVWIEPGEWAMPAFVVIVLLNIAILGPDPGDSLIRFYDRLVIPLAMYWLVRLTAPGPRDLRLLAWVALATIVGQVVVGSLSWVAPSILPSSWTPLAGARTVGSLGNVAVYSSTLVFCAMLLLGDWPRPGRLRRALYALAIVATGIFVVLTFSRGSWLAGVVALGAFLLLDPRNMLRAALPGLVIAVLLGATILSASVGFALERLNDEATAEGRIVGNVASLRMIERQPITGWGYESYNLYWEKFKTRVEEIPVQTGGTSHNTFLTMMAELGIPTFLIYATPVGWWLFQSWRLRRRLARAGPLSLRLVACLWVAALFSFSVSNFMDMIRFNYFGTTIFWLAIGLIATVVGPVLARSRTDRALG